LGTDEARCGKRPAAQSLIGQVNRPDAVVAAQTADVDLEPELGDHVEVRKGKSCMAAD